MARLVFQAALVQPWVTREFGGALVADQGRPVVLLPASVERVALDGSDEHLPLIGRFSDQRLVDLKKFELPATAGGSSPGPTDDQIGITLRDARDMPTAMRIGLRRGLSNPCRAGADAGADAATADDGTGSAPLAPWRRAVEAAAKMIDLHLGLIIRLHEEAAARTTVVHFDTARGGVGNWPLSHVIATWRQVGRNTGPRPALIVALAEQLARRLSDVCGRPRRTLTRQRQLQPAGRIQDIDATCLRWLARQPGTTVAEKFGVKQLAMGVACTETAQTLENRVVADLLRKAADACGRYLEEHRHESEHQAVAQVADFSELVARLRSDSAVAALRPLRGIPRPNNALLHDPRYRPLWQAYLRLEQEQLQRRQAWRWRHRVWSETCQLTMLAALEQIADRSVAARSRLPIRSEQVCGRFIDAQAAIGRWEVRRDPAAYSVLLVESRHFEAYQAVAPFPMELTSLCPDMALICRDARLPDRPPTRVLGIWTLFDFDLDKDQLEARCRQVFDALRLVRTPTDLHGLVIQPDWETAGADTEQRGPERQSTCVARNERNVCRGVRLPVPLQLHESVLASLLAEVLA